MIDLDKLEEIIANRGECAGPMTTFKHGAHGEDTHVSIVCGDNWVEVIRWLAAMNNDVPEALAELKQLRRERNRARTRVYNKMEVIDGVAVIPHDCIESFLERLEELVDTHDDGDGRINNYLDDAATNIRQLLAQYRELQAVLDTPLPDSYEEPYVFGEHAAASWLDHDLHRDDVIGLGAALIRIGLELSE